MKNKKILLRLMTLLLLMTAGKGVLWGQGTILYSQDYESATDASSWYGPNLSPTLETDDPVYGKYIQQSVGNNNSRSAYTNWGTSFYVGYDKYTLEFDASLYFTYGSNNQRSELTVMANGFSSPANNSFFIDNNPNQNYLFHIQQELAGDPPATTTTFYVNQTSNGIVLPSGVWCHYKLLVDGIARTVNYTIINNSTSDVVTTGTYNLPAGTDYRAVGLYYQCGRYNSVGKFDNIVIKDGLCSYTVQSDAGTIFGQGSVFVGTTVSVAVPRFESRNNSLYETNTLGGDYYHKVFAVTYDGMVETINYNHSTTPNVFYYTEAEDVSGAKWGVGLSTRTSKGYVGYTNSINDYLAVTTLPPGQYKVVAHAGNGNSSSRTAKFRVAETDVNTFTIERSSNSQDFGSLAPFTVTAFSEFSFACEGSSSSGLDWFYIQAILAFKDTGTTYTLGSGTQDISQRLLNGTGQSVTYSSSNTAIVSVDANTGVLSLNGIGRVTITATAGGYTAKCLVTVRSTDNATATLSYNETTHIETMSITGTGNFDEKQKGGQRIIFSVGNPDEVQYVEQYGGLYAVNADGESHAKLQNGISGPPVSGTYYAFTPKFSGKLTFTAAILASNPVCLTNDAGVVLEYVNDLTTYTDQTRTFNTRLQSGETYYVYVATGAMTALTTQTGQTVPVSNTEPILYLKSFSFDSTQSEEMTINVSDLLYPTVDGGINSANNRLDRAIPGFTLTFSGGDGATSYNSNSITFHQNASGVGQLDIAPRLLNGATAGDIVFTGVTLNYNNIASGGATSVIVNGQSASMGVGTTSLDVTLATASPTLTIKYGSETDDNSFVLESLTLKYAIFGQGGLDESLDRSRTATQLSFDQSELYVSNGHPKRHPGLFITPSSPQAYHNGDYFSGSLSYSSANPSIATVASDGTVTMLATDYGRQTTISAQFLGTSYFLPSTVATCTVISSVQLTNSSSYTIEHVKRGMVVEAVIGSDGTTVLDFASTIATSQQVSGADGQLISTYAFDNGGSNDEFNVVISYVSGNNAYLYSAHAYYKKPELQLNYSPQAVYNHHGNWNDATLQTRFANNQGVTTCFDLEGEPTFTALFEGKDLMNEFIGPSTTAVYEKTGNIEFVIDPSSTPKATVRSTGSGSAITDATVSVPVTLRSTALGYDPTDANNIAVAHLPVIPFPYTWDFTNGGDLSTITKGLQIDNVDQATAGEPIYNDAAHNYLATGVLLTPSSKSTIAYITGKGWACNYEMDPEKSPSRIYVPVMKGMKVSISCVTASWGNDVIDRRLVNNIWLERNVGHGYPLSVSNVTDLRGYSTATCNVLNTVSTQHFIANDDGYVELYNRSDINVIITSITVTAPELIFADGTSPKVSRTATYENRVLNIPTQATLTFDDDDNSNTNIATRNNGTYTFQSNANGQVVVTATTGNTAHSLEPCWGQYTLSIEDFYFAPNTITLNHTQPIVSYHASLFLANAKLYLNGTEWSALSDEEKAKISFSVAAPAYIDGDTSRPNNAKGLVTELNDLNDPYVMEVRNDGQLIITAIYRGTSGSVSTVKTTCTVNINLANYAGFKYPAPTVGPDVTSFAFATAGSDNPLDATTLSSTYGYNIYYIGKDSNQEALDGSYINWNNSNPSLDLTKKGSGVYCVVAVRDDGGGVYTPLSSFFLTKAYPVTESTSQSWDFRNGLHDSSGEAWDNKVNGQNLFERTYVDWAKGMPTERGSDYRYLWNVNGNNGYIIRETAGLLVISQAPTCDRSITGGVYCDGHFSAYSGEKFSHVYPNIGLHQSSLIIPHLPKGAYVAVAWDRTGNGDGNTMVLENLLDLEGKTIDEIQYGGSVRLSGANAGNQQGYYTFRVANNGNVTFTQNDKGTSRIVAIHVYYGNPDTDVDASDDVYYNLNATQEYKGSGMTQKLMAYARANADGTADTGSGLMELDGILTTEGETTSQWLTNYLNFSAPNGVPEFKMVNQDVTLHNMTMDMSQTYFDSGNGAYAVPGLTFNGACWGKAILSVGVRDNNGYLVAYRQYRFTVGIRPKMQYPKTWDFTRYFDNVTAKIEDSPVTVLPQTTNLNTKNKLAANTAYEKTTISVSSGVIDTDPTRTWDTGNDLMRSSGTLPYLKYGYNEYSSYYVDDAVLVCNLGRRNADGFILEETRGLGFSIAPESDTDTSKKLQWVMPAGTVGYGENNNLTLNGTITIAAIGESYKGYYVFLRSSRPPDAYSDNLRAVNSGDYNGIVSNEGQYVFEVRSASDMTMTFSSDTEIYGIGVTNIQKDSMHPVGGMGWATESRDVDIDYTLTDYYTKHSLRTYEVKFDSYDMNTATVKLTEVKNSEQQTYDSNTNFIDRGYVPKGTGIVLAETNVSQNAAYKVPLFVPAITTTHESVVSADNMMRPNLVTKQYNSETDGDNTRFLLTNIHWTFTKGGNLAAEEAGTIQEADAAGFYRQHVWRELTPTENAAKNTMASNTAYLLVPTSQLPVAVWDNAGNSSRVVNTIAIRFDDVDGINNLCQQEQQEQRQGWYTLDGVRLDGQPAQPGLYIHNGSKVVVKRR